MLDDQLKARLPSEHQAGYGPRLSALIGELRGMHRASQAIALHYDTIAALARQAPLH